MNPRKLAPSMSLLQSFEASARLQSFTRAAQELSLTQSAVSRQVQALEELLEIELFHRHGRTIALTEVGAIYMREISVALARIRDASLQAISYRTGGGALHLAVLPSVATKWLMPRLSSFYARHPNIQVHVHARIGQFDLQLTGMDAVISNSPDGQWPGAMAYKLLDEELVPVVSPTVAKRFKRRDPSELRDQLLLQVAARPNVWREWFDAMGMPDAVLRKGPLFELTSHLLQAVAADLGAGLVARFLVQDELESGRLVLACESTEYIALAYYLFVPTQRMEYPPVKAFREWVIEMTDLQSGREHENFSSRNVGPT